jgi:hypothetical protein
MDHCITFSYQINVSYLWLTSFWFHISPITDNSYNEVWSQLRQKYIPANPMSPIGQGKIPLKGIVLDKIESRYAL